MPPRIPRVSVKREAKQQLIESLRDLSRDAASYDKGEFNAVNRSSVTLRSLFHKTRYSHSLLQTLDIENDIYFRSFAPKIHDDTVVDYGNLYAARFLHFNYLRDEYEFQDVFLFNPINSKAHSSPFTEWWKEPLLVFSDEAISRKQLILAAANEDGGAHFDSKFKEAFRTYYNLKFGNTGIFVTEPITPPLMKQLFGNIYTNPEPKTIHHKGITLALLRQVIHEVEISFGNWQKLPTNYQPNFDYNWHRKTNITGWNFQINDET